MTEYSNILNILEECENLIASGKTKQALTLILSLKDKEVREKTLKLSNRHSVYEEDFDNGQLTHDEFTTRINRITKSTIKIITDERAKFVKRKVSKSSDEVKNSSNTLAQKLPRKEILLGRKSGKYVLIIGGLLIALLVRHFKINN